MITKPSNHIKSDFRIWGKLVTAADVDPTLPGDYALGGQWIQADESVSLDPGRWLVCITEEHSTRDNHYYISYLIDGNGKNVNIEPTIANALNQAWIDGRITEIQRARARFNTLYAYALYISLQPQS